MTSAPACCCRVLELGCADGGNLRPMAFRFPQSTFVGVDVSERQVAVGNRAIAELGQQNIRLETRGILDIGRDFGEFDYIIAHGVYSWVAETVRDKLIQICRTNLAPHGIAYVSYNTYPGWHSRDVVRRMLQYHMRECANPNMRVAESRTFLELLSKSVARDSSLGCVVARELEFMRGTPDSLIMHDLLEHDNHPVYFHEFVEHARHHGLRYLCEAHDGGVTLESQPPAMQRVIRDATSSREEIEQYLDFLCTRMFRSTLLCHDDVELSPTPQTEAVPGLHALGFPILGSSAGGHDNPSKKIVNSYGVELDIAGDGQPAAELKALARAWPESVAVHALVSSTSSGMEQTTSRNGSSSHESTSSPGLGCSAVPGERRRGTKNLRQRGLASRFASASRPSQPDPALDLTQGPQRHDTRSTNVAERTLTCDNTGARSFPHSSVLANSLLQAQALGLVEFFSEELQATGRIGLRPLVCPYVRNQAASGRNVVTNLHHEDVEVDPDVRQLLVWLDGTRDRQDLVVLMRKARERQEAFVDGHKVQRATPASQRSRVEPAKESVAVQLEAHLDRLRRWALLLRSGSTS